MGSATSSRGATGCSRQGDCRLDVRAGHGVQYWCKVADRCDSPVRGIPTPWTCPPKCLQSYQQTAGGRTARCATSSGCVWLGMVRRCGSLFSLISHGHGHLGFLASLLEAWLVSCLHARRIRVELPSRDPLSLRWRRRDRQAGIAASLLRC